MELSELRRLYDLDQRRDQQLNGLRREVDGPVVRYVGQHDPRGYVAYSCLTAGEADAAIQRQQAYFSSLGYAFEWTVYVHDQPPDLLERLQDQGFEAEEMESILVLDLADAAAAAVPPTTHDVRRVRTIEGVEDAMRARQESPDESPDDHALRRRLERELREIPDRMSLYVVYADGVPACSGWLRIDPASPFASLWGGVTRPEYRQRGLYTALVRTRVREAIDRGARFLTVDAQSMSRPILQNLGFFELTRATPMMWRSSGLHPVL